VVILAVGFSPIDVEATSFGTLALLSEQGHKVVVVNLTSGKMPQDKKEAEKLSLRRLGEGARTSALIGSSYSALEFKEEDIKNQSEEVYKKLTTIVESLKPDVIFTHSESETNKNGTFTATLVKRVIENKEINLYQFDNLDGSNFEANVYVDITEVFEKKIEATVMHVSQVEFLHKTKELNIVHNVEVLALYRGLQKRCRYAEAFFIKEPTKHLF
jgi:LmbE family N-acetylglucosaminyl deacetylase